MSPPTEFKAQHRGRFGLTRLQPGTRMSQNSQATSHQVSGKNRPDEGSGRDGSARKRRGERPLGRVKAIGSSTLGLAILGRLQRLVSPSRRRVATMPSSPR